MQKNDTGRNPLSIEKSAFSMHDKEFDLNFQNQLFQNYNCRLNAFPQPTDEINHLVLTSKPQWPSIRNANKAFNTFWVFAVKWVMYMHDVK